MKFLQEIVKQLFQIETDANDIQSIGGGCIHQAGSFQHAGKTYFLKWSRNASEMFEAESRGLKLLQEAKAIDTPRVIGTGSVEASDYLCLEFVEQSLSTSDFWLDFGSRLADLHRATNPKFGLDHNNFIGSLRQSNKSHYDWAEFFVNERLLPQLKMAKDGGLVTSGMNAKFESLFVKLAELFPPEPPSLLHGDLWSGNFLVGKEGQAVIFDPASYYGHREAELAFTRMFGGFDPLFYSSYNDAYPLQSGHEERIGLFNLYPLLVHVNLFGASYLSGIEQTLRRFA